MNSEFEKGIVSVNGKGFNLCHDRARHAAVVAESNL